MGALVSMPLAHAAHWYFLPLYGIPVGIVIWSVLGTLRQRRRLQDKERGKQPPKR
jgi:hypothetical protein